MVWRNILAAIDNTERPGTGYGNKDRSKTVKTRERIRI